MKLITGDWAGGPLEVGKKYNIIYSKDHVRGMDWFVMNVKLIRYNVFFLFEFYNPDGTTSDLYLSRECIKEITPLVDQQLTLDI